MGQPIAADANRIDEQLRFVNIVCIALVIGVGALAGVGGWLTSEPGELGPLGPPLPRALAIAAAVVGLALLLVAPYVYRRMLASAAHVTRDQERTVGVLETYRLATLLAFILREGCAIVGLMITLLTDQPGWCYALGAAALVAMFWDWPRREQLASLLAAA